MIFTISFTSRGVWYVIPGSVGAFNLNLSKYSDESLMRQKADLDELVADRQKVSGVAWMTTASPYRDRHVKDFVNAVSMGPREE